MRGARAEGFHHADLARLLHGHGDERVHDAERGDDDDEHQNKKHHAALQPDCVEAVFVAVNPRLCVRGRLELFIERIF